ncbi:uncharacterized protein [Dysidea avara]|uniref:uncharacterized protein isoform X2 n=1 Tax=Dysidea avara TaxID=196820 RepID=UPI003324A810
MIRTMMPVLILPNCKTLVRTYSSNEPLAENLAKSDQPPDDGDVPPSGEAAIQESNNSPVNPPHYQGVLDGFASGGNTRFTSLQLSPYLYGEGTKEQLLPVKQQCNFEETVADPVVDPVEAIDHPTAQNSAQLCSQTNSNGGLATCEIVSPTTTTYTTTITVHAKDSIKDVKKETELDSFTSECGGLAEARRKSPVPIGPLHSPVGTITVCPIPVSGGPQNVVTASTQQAATVWNYEELSLDPRNTRL